MKIERRVVPVDWVPMTGRETVTSESDHCAAAEVWVAWVEARQGFWYLLGFQSVAACGIEGQEGEELDYDV